MKRNKRFFVGLFPFLVTFFLITSSSVFSADGDGKLQEFYSPGFLGSSASTAVLLPPGSTLLNPASAALSQRTTFEGSYVGIAGSDESSSGWKGHVLNFGHTIPTKLGVFTWTSSFLSSSFDSLNTGTQFSLNGSFAKDVYPDTYIGAGIKTSVGEGPDFMLAADFGLIRTQPSLFFLEDVRWSVVLQNLGYSTIDMLRPPMYGLNFGVNGQLFQSGKITGRLTGDLSWTDLDNLRLSTGLRLKIGESFNAAVGSRFDLQKIFDDRAGELLPSLSLSYTYIPGDSKAEPWTRNELQPYAAAAPLSSSLWAGAFGVTVPLGRIDEEAPDIEIDLSGIIKRYAPEGASGGAPEAPAKPADPEYQPEGSPEGSTGDSPAEDGQVENQKKDRTGISVSRKGKPATPSFSLSTMQRVTDDSGLFSKEGEKKASDKAGENPLEGEASNGTAATEPTGTAETRVGNLEEAEKPKTAFELTEEELDNPVPEADIYLSPNNDGIQDSLSFPITFSEKRYIKGYEFVVEDSEDRAVRTIINKETRPEKRTVKTFFGNLFASKSGIQVPESLRWDGTTDSGEVAPDGLYHFYIRAWDDNENYGTSEKYSVYIDTLPPTVTVEEAAVTERIFSPNNDGNKDTLHIRQKGTREDLWSAVIENSSGQTVKSFFWRDEQPESFEWDGTNDVGILVPDGVHLYRISAFDRAGNSGSAEYGNLVKNTEPTPVGLTINHSHFSPNGDNILDTVLLEPEVPVRTGISRWSLEVKDETGRVRRRYEDNVAPTGTIAFDGKDDRGASLPEGRYHAELKVLYINGNNPSAESAPFFIDITPPTAVINIDNRIFSPNGDGVKDRVTITQETSLEENWYGTITDIDGNIIYQYKWIDRAEISVSWDGRNEKGSLMDDGFYFYQLSTVDRAGNHGESERLRFELNTEETEVILTTSLDYFSPNGDGTKDTIDILPRLKGSRRVRDYTLSILDENRNEIFNRKGTGDVPESFRWDGFSDIGNRAPDGSYTAVLEVTNLNGNRNTAETQAFVIDTVPPGLELTMEYDIFSPEGDGYKDTITFSVKNPTHEELWESRIVDSEGTTVKNMAWRGLAKDFEWDGTDNAGNSVADGTYTYHIFSTDRAGNFFEAESGAVVLDTGVTRLFITTDTDKLSPNGDGLFEEIAFTTIVSRKEGLESWKVEIVGTDGSVRKVFSGTERIPQKIIWNGVSEDGKKIEGEYKAVFSAVYTKGNRPEAVSLPFRLDVTAPTLSVSLDPVPFSPDNDGVDDELNIGIDVKDRNEIERWSFTIYDAERSENRNAGGPVFRSYSGMGKPAREIIWDGRSNNGELVYAAMDYPYRMEVQDVFGNTAVETGKIPIDVLVIREGNLLKIKIANINFKPNDDAFVDEDPELAARNQYVLDRIAEILQKYRQYRITIQGHANVTRFWDPEEARREQIEELLPLSTRRAERVMEALIDRGIERNRLNAEGVGGSQPLVAFDDAENRWKNRRVEFILEKK
jgi:flagellar hook assembly protein FlgD/outer membrane protein OmpA-like peptidoglycan-associated protein